MNDRPAETLEALLVMLKSMSEDATRVAHNIDVIIGIVASVIERLPVDNSHMA